MQARALWRQLVLPLPWRLPKPRTRRAWASWDDDDRAIREDHFVRVPIERAGAVVDRRAMREWDVRVQAAKAEAQRTGEPVRLPAAPDFNQGGLLLLNVNDSRIDGYVEPSEPQDLTSAQRRRRALADRLAVILAQYPPGDQRAAYMIGSLSLPAKLSYARSLREALMQAPQVAEASEPGAVKVVSEVSGVVIRMHAPAWSLVFRYSPYRSPVLFVTDEVPEQARRVDEDLDWQPEITAALDAAVRELSRYSLGGDKYLYRPS